MEMQPESIFGSEGITIGYHRRFIPVLPIDDDDAEGLEGLGGFVGVSTTILFPSFLIYSQDITNADLVLYARSVVETMEELHLEVMSVKVLSEFVGPRHTKTYVPASTTPAGVLLDIADEVLFDTDIDVLGYALRQRLLGFIL